MLISEIQKSKGLTKKSKRIGRGNSSGKGNYSTRGLKGQGARTGSKSYAWFEGGQTPLGLRLPKLKGFKRPLKLVDEIIPVNINKLDKDERIASGSEITKAVLLINGYIKKETLKVKILGTGEISKSLTFSGMDAFSANAKEKIEKAGGKII